MPAWAHYLVIVLIVICIAFINLRGTGAVSISTLIYAIIVLTPFIISTVMGLGQWQFSPFEPFIAEGQSAKESIAYGLMVGMWMYCGYEAVGSVAEEIEGAYHKIPKGLLICLAVTTLTYFLPTLVGYAVMGDWSSWAPEAREDLPEPITYITMGIKIGGSALGVAFLISAIFSNLTCYNSYIGSGSRVPFAMARDRMFFQSIRKVNNRWGTPHVAIIASSVVALILSFSSFAVLVTTVMTLYLVAVALFLIACPVLRVRRPDERRPFKIPGGVVFLCLILIIPLGTITWTLFTQPVADLTYGLIGLASGPVAYLIFKTIYKGRPGLASEEMLKAKNRSQGD
jgi:amino acid transporter